MAVQHWCHALLFAAAHTLGVRGSPPSKSWSTHCHTTSWWLILPVPSEHVIAQLPKGFKLASHGLPFPSGMHPLYLELNRQSDCTEHIIPIKAPDMLEFKVQLPFVVDPSVGAVSMYKPQIYEDVWLNVLGSRGVYGLPTDHADMSQDGGSYEVRHSGNMISGHFEPVGPWVGLNQSSTFDKSFRRINDDYPWLCHALLSSKSKCAFDYYDWDRLRIRPVKGNLSVTGTAIPHFDARSWSHLGDFAFQVDVQLYISSPQACSASPSKDFMV